jgi:Predicted esterase of the alpha/beta hydrolase fold
MDVIILHGTYGSPSENWFPWLRKQLEVEGHNVFVPKFPTPKNQSVQNWCKILEKEAPRFGKNTILVGHSCGATYMLSILSVLEKPVHQSIFVSGFLGMLGDEEYDIPNRTFYDQSFDWQKICKNAGETTVLHGNNDPYVPRSHAETLAKNLGVNPIFIKDGGHLNSESGYTKFPLLLEIINKGNK